MSRHTRTLRRICGLIALLALGTQAIAQAQTYADLADAVQTGHCAGQDHGQDDCPCCPDSTPLPGCAGLCSMMTALPMTSADLPFAGGERILRTTERGTLGPAYLPLIPPPIA